MKISMAALFVLLAFSLNTQAAQDHNSSRSNKTASIASDLGNESDDFARDVLTAQEKEYESGDLIDRTNKLQKKVESMQLRMVIGTFANLLLRNLQEMKCESLRDEACLNRAIISAERETLSKSRP